MNWSGRRRGIERSDICDKGRFHARVVVVAAAAASAGHDSQRAHMFSRERGLTPIQENSDE